VRRVEQARTERVKQTELGLDQAALDEAARRGFAMGAFEDVEDDGLPIIEEFFPDEAQEKASTTPATNVTKPVLRERLTAKTNMLPDRTACRTAEVDRMNLLSTTLTPDHVRRCNLMPQTATQERHTI